MTDVQVTVTFQQGDEQRSLTVPRCCAADAIAMMIEDRARVEAAHIQADRDDLIADVSTDPFWG